jgi:hypothetical protein
MLLLASCTGCYAPDAPECTLACAADTDCISGQACTSDGFCAASSSTQCVQRQAEVDAPNIQDAPKIQDAGATTVTVHVTVSGNGTVTASTGATCASDCTFDVAKDVPMTLTATADSVHQAFLGWSGACAWQRAVCQVTPNAAITVGAKFTGGD